MNPHKLFKASLPSLRVAKTGHHRNSQSTLLPGGLIGNDKHRHAVCGFVPGVSVSTVEITVSSKLGLGAKVEVNRQVHL